MKDCTRKDVVSANIISENKINAHQKRKSERTWRLRKESMQSDDWVVSDQSLKVSEYVEETQSSLDVSIVYEKKLQKFINKIEFSSDKSGEKQPSNLSDKIILELNSISSAAAKLANRLSSKDSSKGIDKSIDPNVEIVDISDE